MMWRRVTKEGINMRCRMAATAADVRSLDRATQ